MGLGGGTCGDGAGPGPLEVVAAEPAGDVNDFADEEEARGEFAFEGAGVEFVGGDAAGGDFGFLEAFGAGGGDGPGVKVGFECGDAVVGPVAGTLLRVEFDPAFGEACGKSDAESGVGGVPVAAGACVQERGEDFDFGCEVDVQRCAGFPVGRDLQCGGAADAAVGDEEFFAEGDGLGVAAFGGRGGCGDDFRGETGEVAPQ